MTTTAAARTEAGALERADSPGRRGLRAGTQGLDPPGTRGSRLGAVIPNRRSRGSVKVWKVSPRLLRAHPRADLVPALPQEEYDALREDIRVRGIQVALAVRPGDHHPSVALQLYGRQLAQGKGAQPRDDSILTILCGHQRLRAALELGLDEVPVTVADLNGTCEDEYIILDNLRRRQLSPYGRTLLALKLEEVIAERAKGHERAGGGSGPSGRSGLPMSANPIDTREEVAKAARVSHDTVAKVKQIEEKATPEQKERLTRGEATINQVYVAVRREEAKRQVAQAEWPTGKYRVIYADPPWQYSNTQPSYHSVQDDHYPTMPLGDICDLPVRGVALEDAVLFLWATSPILEDAFKVLHAWGFAYKASFVWDKVKHNMGHYNSVRHEFLLVAVRGSCPPDTPKLFDSVVVEERTEHSTKPEAFRKIIDSLYPHGPRVELFARRKVDGWEACGNDLP